MNYSEFIPGILSVGSDKSLAHGFVYGSHGHHLPLSHNSARSSKIALHLQEQSGVLFDPAMLSSTHLKNERFWYSVENQSLGYSRQLIGNFRAQYSLQFDSTGLNLEYNSAYRRYAELRFSQHDLPERILSAFTYFLLLEQGFLSLHCAAANYQEVTVSLFALPDTGKTSTLYDLVENHGYGFISEDIAVTDGHYIYSCPYTRSGVWFIESPRSIITKARWLLTKRSRKERLIDHLSQNKLIVNKAKPSLFIILRRGPKSIKQLTFEEATSQLYALNMAEFGQIARSHVYASSYLLGRPDLKSLTEQEYKLVEAFLRVCSGYYVVTSPNSSDFSRLILNLVNELT